MGAFSDPQRVRRGPAYELAGWGQRFNAMFIDAAINLVPAAAVFWLLNAWSATHGHFLIHLTVTESGGGTFTRHVYGLNPVGLIAWLLIVSLYWGVLMGRRGEENGQTIGMRRAGIRLVTDNGEQVTGILSILRFMAQAVLWAAFVVPGLLDTLWPLWERENRTWHDLLCRTHVVRARSMTRTWTP